MVLFPRIGKLYWIVTDLYETFCAVPVTLERKGGLFDYGNGGKGLFVGRWDLTPEYQEYYDASRRELFSTEAKAAKVADALNREAGRNAGRF